MSKKPNLKFRFNFLTTIIYVVGIILLLQLFNLQIVHGNEYREKSNTRLTRESKIEADRGSILDKSGNTIVGNTMGFSIDLYKTKIDEETLNKTILNVINVLEQNGDTYIDDFIININPYSFNASEEKVKKFKKDNEIEDNATPEECFYIMKEEYEIENTDVAEARKIMAIRYAIQEKGYSSTKPLKIAENIKRESVLIFNEKSSEFPGINVVVEPVRNYEQGTTASHIVGYTGRITSKELETRKDTYDQDDIIGKNGIESTFEEYLKGEDGIKQLDMSVDGTVQEEYTTKEAVKGSDVVLTIDLNLQRVTEEALANTINKINTGGYSKRYETNSGAAVVMEVKTGKILAMASFPTYNPQDFVGTITTEKWNEYNQNPDLPLMNKTIQSAYAPGSIFKMVTAIAGLESGVVNTTEKVNDTGTFYHYNDSWKCWQKGGHGWLNITGAIEKSCNYFFYTIGTRMDVDTLAKYAKYFGLGVKTEVELPGEVSGTVASRETAKKAKRNWYPGDMMSAVIGQSYNAFTPLQMAKYISMVANGGEKITPTILETVIKADGTEIPKDEVEQKIKSKLGITDNGVEDLEISKTSIDVVKEGMRSVTSDESGTAYSVFKDFPIEVGGKTGSAETERGSGNGKTNAWFAGFAPFDDPEIAVVVFVENGGHGWYTAETVKYIMEQYFGMNIAQVQEDMTQAPYVETYR
ncbi:MAG: penicillin-binding protein 2 [Clostridia bacterium]